MNPLQLTALPRAALAATIALVFGACDVDDEKITLKPLSFAELPGWSEDDHAAAFGALLKSCRKAPSPDETCAAALALGDGISREAARSFFDGLSNSVQRYHVDNIATAKTEETRQRRIDKTVELFRNGKQR